MLDGAKISSNAQGPGQGSDLIIDADRVVVFGVNREPFPDTSQPANQLSLDALGIISQEEVIGGKHPL